ncbi:polysaccharide deacetylase family protein [Aneurinibacillus aneurinilyticus]|nr:polysaccharide deacetylase family protein [Aneurinibacillus aneurinilyticus]MCI1694077.1 polysaccharide deacetylase family protein [Aneurinibacillus aneurinilyticus]MED0708441.1 polysaccharide deacetylase family protein [Aneurinibacillus aneurinilyticus]MED0723239.1 polysaccharide deacetylase family protein [Aneurinibacillus aneurinilyticus]MED0732938.1 polysaccharide deacetylase family protein [Aneurinibacillus aneurinilyticus]MED0739623.1 polysaccharide deacetylase family protein [Aneurin
MGKLLAGVLIFFIMLYAVVPEIATRIIGVGALRKGRLRKEIALTFDDGPDPYYTPRLLDLLKKHNIKATFFIVGAKAEKHPDIIKRIQREGHLIGIHNYVHRANWFMNPWRLWQQIHYSADVIEQITGQRPVHYRPPWGLFTIFDFILGQKFSFVLWSVMVGDWRSRIGRDALRKKILTQLHDGCVIVLHDSGETFGADRDAPMHMLEALEDVLQAISKQPYKFVLIDEIMKHA